MFLKIKSKLVSLKLNFWHLKNLVDTTPSHFYFKQFLYIILSIISLKIVLNGCNFGTWDYSPEEGFYPKSLLEDSSTVGFSFFMIYNMLSELLNVADDYNLNLNTLSLTENQYLYGAYVSLIDLQISTGIVLYEKLLMQGLIKQPLLTGETISKASFNLIKAFDDFMYLRMNIWFITTNIHFDFKVMTMENKNVFLEYVRASDHLKNCLRIFLNENLCWSKLPEDLKNELELFQNNEYINFEYFNEFNKKNLFKNYFDKELSFLKRPKIQNRLITPWESILTINFLEYKTSWDIYVIQVLSKKVT
jgi:hypothetical protein